MRLGSDPEVFLVSGAGKLISAIGLIGADKWNPQQVEKLAKGFTLQEDNVTMEFGIPPAASADELFLNLETVMHAGLEKAKGLKFSTLSCAVFDEDQMQDPKAHIFGCEPDFNAWFSPAEEQYVNLSPCPSHPYMRSAGGHIHVETQADPGSVVRAMDLYLGVPSILMDKGEQRRQMYGRAGAHRLPKHGVEYRSLSNFWIFQKKYVDWVWRNTERALDDLGFADEFGYEIQMAMNKNDKHLARDLCDAFALEVVK